MREKYLKLENKIKEFDTIIIAKHVNPDFDAIGSAFGLKFIIEDNFKDKKVFVVGSKIDEGKYENPQLTEAVIKKSILITCDTANKERVDFEFINEAKEIFKIDHHVDGDDFGHCELVDSSAIACCQMIAIWSKEMNLKISKEAASHLYKGLITDSNRFLYKNTNAQTFEAAQFLISTGIDFVGIYDSLYIRSLEVQKWINKCFSKAEFINGVAHIKIFKKEYEDLSLTLEEVKSSLGSICGIKEIKISILAIEVEDQIKISLRSSNYSVNQIANKFGGGGHRLAAACKIASWDDFSQVLEAAQILIKSEEKNVN
ncbi:bifunctional oligoribonuclease/PAP phosphatase NrnA [Spiroplasma endosymbiont of Panorpa germanica]|uniref:DHH family phosphoesterase n=1 Tax=Spiroplasma endosymbiont of Panorpa germanica TaxID=3066314 RepID=UPI0030D05E7E